jgi:hypothetical protein
MVSLRNVKGFLARQYQQTSLAMSAAISSLFDEVPGENMGGKRNGYA